MKEGCATVSRPSGICEVCAKAFRMNNTNQATCSRVCMGVLASRRNSEKRVPLAAAWSRWVVRQDGCWHWSGKLSPQGYGRLYWGCQRLYAHRVGHELYKGPIPEGMVIDHLCRNTVCVNPDHLEAVPQRINALRGQSPSAVHAAQTHCINGHELTEHNIYWRPDTYGRQCRACARAREQRRIRGARRAS